MSTTKTAMQVLVATMYAQADLPARLNLQSDAIIVDQCDNDYNRRDRTLEGHTITTIGSRERGTARSRNAALARATADICLLADDDVRLSDSYPQIVQEWASRFPKADVIVFNLGEVSPTRWVVRRPVRISYHNFMRIGAPRVAFRRESIARNGIFFPLVFGGISTYGNGEDVLFILQCLRKGLRVIAVPENIASLLPEQPSTWFKGHSETYFRDKGALYAAMSPTLAPLLTIQFCYRHREMYRTETSFVDAVVFAFKGAAEFTTSRTARHRLRNNS